jgi:hypothetical protein
MQNPFVFLLGCPRSGTTLLRRLVNAHPEIAIVPEIRWLADRYKYREGLTEDGRLTPAFLGRLRNFGRFSPIPLEPRELADLVESRMSISYADFMSALFDVYGRKQGKVLVGQKNADHAVPMDIPTLHELWPQAKFIHLIRDGRDVCLSLLHWRIREKVGRLFSTWVDDPVATAAVWWEWQVRLAVECGDQIGPSLYMEVRYEDLVSRSAEVCARLCEFMGVKFDEAMLRFHENPPRQNPKQPWLPPTPGRRDWRSQMSSEDQARFEAVAGGLLDELGYSRVARRPTADAATAASLVRAAFDLRPLPQNWPRIAGGAPGVEPVLRG